MPLSNRDRDELLIEMFSAITHLIGILEDRNHWSARILNDKVKFFKQKLQEDEPEVKTMPTSIPPPPNLPLELRNIRQTIPDLPPHSVPEYMLPQIEDQDIEEIISEVNSETIEQLKKDL